MGLYVSFGVPFIAGMPMQFRFLAQRMTLWIKKIKKNTSRRGNNPQVKTLGRTIGDTMKQDGKIKGRPLTTKLWASMLHKIKRLNPSLH